MDCSDSNVLIKMGRNLNNAIRPSKAMATFYGMVLLSLGVFVGHPLQAERFGNRTEVDYWRLGPDFNKQVDAEEKRKEEERKKIETARAEEQKKKMELERKMQIAEVWGQKSMDAKGNVSYTLPPEYVLTLMTETDPEKRKEAYENYLQIRMMKNRKIGEAATEIQKLAYEKYITPDVYYTDPMKKIIQQKEDQDTINLFTTPTRQGTYLDDKLKPVQEKNIWKGKKVPGEIQHPIQVLFFYDIDCPHCKKVMPEVELFATQYAEYMDLKGISAGKDPNRLAAFLHYRSETKNPLPFYNFADVYDYSSNDSYSKDYGVTRWPTVVMINTEQGSGFTLTGSDKTLPIFVKALQAIHDDAKPNQTN